MQYLYKKVIFMSDIQDMLKVLKINNIDDLFLDIPKEARIDRIDIPDGITEQELIAQTNLILNKNKTAKEMPMFIGAGVYNHYIPAAVAALVSRSEFYTAYTPYQPEISQGMLQTLFEYQSYIAELTGMDVANASMYDFATALGEAARMANAINMKKEILIPKNILEEKKKTLQVYLYGLGVKIVEYPYEPATGKVDLKALSALVNENTSAIYAETPNMFGIIDENVMKIRDISSDFVFIVGINPISLGLIKPPGEYGADIVIGEGQILGSYMNFGGPLLGIFATKKEYVRKMPGRLIGMSKDLSGKRAFVMTLQTREQHIRRAKATSNICSNEALCAVTTTIYLSLLGGSGLREVAELNFNKANSVFEKIAKIKGYKKAFSGSVHFNECVIKLPYTEKKVNDELLKRGVHGGYMLNTSTSSKYKDLGESMIFNVTEMHSDSDINLLLTALKEVQ